MSKHAIDTQGWQSTYQLGGQCGTCTWVLSEKRMVACEYGRPEFPAAHNCPKFKFQEEE